MRYLSVYRKESILLIYLKLLAAGTWRHLQPILVLFITTLGKQILLSALGAVTQAAAQTNLSSSEKRDFAADIIRNEVSGAGNKAINLAVEIAVNRLNQ